DLPRRDGDAVRGAAARLRDRPGPGARLAARRRAAVPARRRRREHAGAGRGQRRPPARAPGARARPGRRFSRRPGPPLAAPGGDPPRPDRRRAGRGLLRPVGPARGARARGSGRARLGPRTSPAVAHALLGLRAGDLDRRLPGGVCAVRTAGLLLALLLLAPPACTAPLTLGGRVVAPAALERGREVFTHFCRPCHGDAGDGKGTAAAGLS